MVGRAEVRRDFGMSERVRLLEEDADVCERKNIRIDRKLDRLIVTVATAAFGLIGNALVLIVTRR